MELQLKKRLIRFLIRFYKDERAMSFDMMRIIFMVISIVLGGVVASFVSNYLGTGGGFLGAIIVGIAIYYIYSLLVQQPTSIYGAILFGIVNFIATFIMGLIGARTGIAGGFISLILEASILSLLWGYLGAKGQSNVKTGIQI